MRDGKRGARRRSFPRTERRRGVPRYIKGKPNTIKIALPRMSPPAQSCSSLCRDGIMRATATVTLLTINPAVPAMAKTKFIPRPKCIAAIMGRHRYGRVIVKIYYPWLKFGGAAFDDACRA